MLIRVKLDGHTAELRDDHGKPRVDIWRGVMWIGQWAWTGTELGEEISRSSLRISPETLVALAESIRRKVGPA